MADFKYMRKDFGQLKLKLEHMDIIIKFLEDKVEVENQLQLMALVDSENIELNAKELEINRIDEDGTDLTFDYDKDILTIKRPMKKDEKVKIRTMTTCHPSDNVLEGIYRDTTPIGAPQQYMSQCQQWGFQRIMPVIDDCRAKCTMKTTLIGDSRYTHMISNGDICKDSNPDGKPVVEGNIQKITYVNDIPMAPYLFLACAGTWDMLEDSVEIKGRKIKLEYLVPVGKTGNVQTPMKILKKSVKWIHETQDYEYMREVYRTICMDKSNFGGMENVGNTTIVTDAALVNEHTLDRSLIYAHAVIVHEFEHNQCGSETTMETPFDMWLNEAYTVDVERQFISTQFDPATMRLMQVDSIRDPVFGPLAIEDGGYVGKIARDGFNHPDELVDGLTYVKAAEIIRMLRLIIGQDSFRKGKNIYFSRYKDSNANTDQFFECFEEAYGGSLQEFKEGWLLKSGYPKVVANIDYKDKTTIRLSSDSKHHIPIEYALIDEEGNVMAHEMRHFTGKKIIEHDLKPAFVSLNMDYSFYGTFKVNGITDEMLKKQVMFDPNNFNRVEAMKQLTDKERIAIMKDEDHKPSEGWIQLWGEILGMDLPDALKSRLLAIGEMPLDRKYMAWYQEMVHARKTLSKSVYERFSDEIIEKYKALETDSLDDIEKRMLKGVLLSFISTADDTHDILIEQYKNAGTAQDRVTALLLLNQSSSDKRREMLDHAYESWHDNLSGYANYLRVVAGGVHSDVFKEIEAEKEREGFDITQPTYSRALILPMTFNNEVLWTDEGLAWAAKQIIEFDGINPHVASRMLNCFQLVRKMKPELQKKVLKTLKGISEKVKDPTVVGQVRSYLQ